MDTSLQKYPISKELRTWLLRTLWKRCTPTPEALSLDMSPYLDYYSTRCQRFSRDGGIHICVKSHQTISDISTQIFTDATRYEVCSRLTMGIADGDKERANSTINLCGSLILMAEMGAHKFGYSPAESNPLTWSGQQTLEQAVERHFQPKKELQPDHPRLGRLFTARNLICIGDIKICWTASIVDHLLLSDDDQTVFIFYHATFLRY
jgi:hypothetical protein